MRKSRWSYYGFCWPCIIFGALMLSLIAFFSWAVVAETRLNNACYKAGGLPGQANGRTGCIRDPVFIDVEEAKP